MNLVTATASKDATPYQKFSKEQLELLQALFPGRMDLEQTITLEPLKGGTVCSVYLIKDGKDQSVLRVYCPWHDLKQREIEDEVSKWAAHYGIAPQVLKAVPEKKVMQLEYLSQGTVDPSNKSYLAPLADLVKTLAKCPVPSCLEGQKKSISFIWYERQWETICNHGELSPSLQQFNAIKETVENDVKASGLPFVVTHLGLHAENLMWSDSRLMAIDWDMAGLDYELVEVATIEMRFQLTNEEVQIFLDRYFKNDNDEKRAKYDLVRPIPYFNKVTYPLIKAININPNLKWDEFEKILKKRDFPPLKEIFKLTCEELNTHNDDYLFWLKFAASTFNLLANSYSY